MWTTDAGFPDLAAALLDRSLRKWSVSLSMPPNVSNTTGTKRMPFLEQAAACLAFLRAFMASMAAAVFLPAEGRIELPRGEVIAMSTAVGLPLSDGIKMSPGLWFWSGIRLRFSKIGDKPACLAISKTTFLIDF